MSTYFIGTRACGVSALIAGHTRCGQRQRRHQRMRQAARAVLDASSRLSGTRLRAESFPTSASQYRPDMVLVTGTHEKEPGFAKTLQLAEAFSGK